jgi:hypothetical protein
MRRRMLLLSLLAIPSLAAAQRTKSAATKAPDDLGKAPTPQGPTLRVRDVEDMSPLRMLLDKHKDLKLTDAQTTQIKAAESTLHEKNAPSFKTIDSLVNAMRSVAGGQSDADRGRARLARAGITLALDDISTNNDAAAKEQLASLDADQLAKAKELITKQLEDGKRMLRDRLSMPENGGQ